MLTEVLTMASWRTALFLLTICCTFTSGSGLSDPGQATRMLVPLAVTLVVLAGLLGLLAFFYCHKKRPLCQCLCCREFANRHTPMENTECDCRSRSTVGGDEASSATQPVCACHSHSRKQVTFSDVNVEYLFQSKCDDSPVGHSRCCDDQQRTLGCVDRQRTLFCIDQQRISGARANRKRIPLSECRDGPNESHTAYDKSIAGADAPQPDTTVRGSQTDTTTRPASQTDTHLATGPQAASEAAGPQPSVTATESQLGTTTMERPHSMDVTKCSRCRTAEAHDITS